MKRKSGIRLGAMTVVLAGLCLAPSYGAVLLCAEEMHGVVGGCSYQYCGGDNPCQHPACDPVNPPPGYEIGKCYRCTSEHVAQGCVPNPLPWGTDCRDPMEATYCGKKIDNGDCVPYGGKWRCENGTSTSIDCAGQHCTVTI